MYCVEDTNPRCLGGESSLFKPQARGSRYECFHRFEVMAVKFICDVTSICGGGECY